MSVLSAELPPQHSCRVVFMAHLLSTPLTEHPGTAASRVAQAVRFSPPYNHHFKAFSG